MDVELDGLFRQNGTYNYEDDYVYEEDFEMTGGKVTLVPVLYSLELVIGLLGNGLLLAVLAQKRRSWSISDTFILHLSVADLLLLVTLPFWAIQAAHQCGWCFGLFLCKSSMAVFNVSTRWCVAQAGTGKRKGDRFSETVGKLCLGVGHYFLLNQNSWQTRVIALSAVIEPFSTLLQASQHF